MGKALSRVDSPKVAGFRDQFVSAWTRTDQIFSLIDPGAMLEKPIVWRHPFIFYVGHLPAFSWNQICGAILNWTSYNPYFDDVFCRGVDPDVDTVARVTASTSHAGASFGTLVTRRPRGRRWMRCVGRSLRTSSSVAIRTLARRGLVSGIMT